MDEAADDPAAEGMVCTKPQGPGHLLRGATADWLPSAVEKHGKRGWREQLQAAGT